jgi:PiT family inorganic phosphate transporter
MTSVQMSIEVLVLLIAMALLFAFINGFHDAANSIATVVSTGVLKPQAAVLMAAFFNFAAILVFHQMTVASTVGKDIISPEVVDQYVVFGALSGAIIWNLITWYLGLPSSSTHALIGGLVGAALAKSGSDVLVTGALAKVALFIVLSPLLGFLLGSLMLVIVSWLFVRSTPRLADKTFRRLQLLSAAAYSLGHGGNDAQKTIGVIWLLLIATGHVQERALVPPLWVIVASYVGISLGTLFGGWRIVKTMGQKITKLKPVGGFCAETGGAVMLFVATTLGVPVSTTHTITGAIAGVGSVKRMSGVRWGVAHKIIWAWILTIPASALIAALAWWLAQSLI